MSHLLARDESGVSLVEMVIATAVSLVVLLAVTATVNIANDTTSKTYRQGASLPAALFAAQSIQRALGSSYDPYLGSLNGTITNDCATTSAGTTQYTDSGGTSGIFVSSGTNEVTFCGFTPGSSTAYTYDLYLGPTKPCFTSCTLTLVQWPCTVAGMGDASCAGTTLSTKWVVSGVSQGSLHNAVFTYKSISGATWSTAPSPSSSTQVIEIDLQGVQYSSSGPEVVRDVVLPASLKGMS
ncbi:MAG TPA: hypothetical protein VE991_04780 [Acidimicrobiales bacterium]|nr:hypothetical protein [Acidimicrobiales bacterium]